MLPPKSKFNYYLAPAVDNRPKAIRPDEIISIVSEYTGVPIPTLTLQKKQKTRKGKIPYARHLAMYMIREKKKMDYTKIGRDYFNGAHHTSIMHGCLKIKNLCDVYEETRKDISRLFDLIND